MSSSNNNRKKKNDKSSSRGNFTDYRVQDREESTLGFLDLDSINGLGETSRISDTNMSTLGARLRRERMKALQTLERASQIDKSLRSPSTKSSVKSYSSSNSHSNLNLNHTDYVPYTRIDSINITDLIQEDTIDLRSNSSTCSSVLNKISFEPSEITGRSTMCVAGPSSKASQRSVRDIISSSCSNDIRSLSTTLPNNYDDNVSILTDNIPETTENSRCSTNFRTTFSNCPRADQSDFRGESFTPAEMMNSKLEADEMAWEEEYATIPKIEKSEKVSPINGSDRFSAPNSDFSIGSFFHKRSDNLKDMIPEITPIKGISYPLIEDSLRSSKSSSSGSNQVTPIIDERTYSKHLRSSVKVERKTSDKDDSYVLSVSAIANALGELRTSDEPADFVDKLLSKRIKSCLQPTTEPLANITTNTNKSLQFQPKLSSSSKSTKNEKHENEKENRKPKVQRDIFLSDTASFSESLLDSSDCMINGNSTLPAPQQIKSRKRSHSSTRVENSSPTGPEIPIRRSRSPSSFKELAAASGSSSIPNSSRSPASISCYNTQMLSPSASFENTITSDRVLLLESKSPDCGKLSLPNYGLVSRSTTSLSQHGKFRSNSQCSSSSEFSHRDGKMPLKATYKEMSWGCIKLRKDVRKSIQIKNISNKRLVVRAEVTGPGFQLVRLEQGNLLTLQAQECHTVLISFCPTVIGAAVGKLSFSPPSGNGNEPATQNVFLNGYGGHATVVPQGVLTGPMGSQFLAIGDTSQLANKIVKSFTLYNKGPLSAFACIIINTFGLDTPRFRDCIEIIPNKVLIKPETYVKISIVFKPRRDDIRKILKKITNVMVLANMKIVVGEEATRQRIRNLVAQMNNTQKSEIEKMTLSNVWTTFPSETSVNDLSTLKEQSEMAFELLSTLRHYNIAITLNHTLLDDTTQSSYLFPDADETIMFRTLGSNSSMLSNITETSKDNEEYVNSIIVQRNKVESWSVRPAQLEIDPYDKKTKITFEIKSHFFTKQYYKVESNYRHIFQFTPSENFLYPGDNVEVAVIMQAGVLPSEPIQILIYIENDKIILPVKVKKDKFPAHLR